MKPLALELNDCGIVVSGDPALKGLEPSPGWAVVEAGGILTGTEAAARLRLNPRLAHRRVWSELELTPLPRPFPRGLSSADLAYAHLGAVWTAVGDRLGTDGRDAGARLLAVSGAFTPDQLGLVLGIAESLELPFTGVVDSAVAAASTRPAQRAVLLDLDLERAVATALGPTGSGRIAWQRVRSQQGIGWNSLLDLWARAIGREFVKTTRFDPLHTAGSEQQLYLSLPAWLEELARVGSIEAWLEAGGRQHRIALTRERLADAAEPICAALVGLTQSLMSDSGAFEVVLTHRIGRLPGLVERLEAAGLKVAEPLAPDAALVGTLKNADLVHQPGEAEPRWVVELPASGEAAEAATPVLMAPEG